MRLISTGRAGGKTTKLVQMLRESPDSLLLVESTDERARIIHELGLMNDSCADLRILTFYQFLEGRSRGRRVGRVLIDQVDQFIQAVVSQQQPGAEVVVAGDFEMDRVTLSGPAELMPEIKPGAIWRHLREKP